MLEILHQERPGRIAVIGGGAAGLSAAWLLSRRQEVDLYEKEGRLGGHANTVDVEIGGGRIPVDTGFIVYNERNYPDFTALLAHLDCPTRESDMSFAASLSGGRFEYSGRGLLGLFDHGLHLPRGRAWRMLRDILRLYRTIGRHTGDGEAEPLTLGQYLERHSYSKSFCDDHILPMCAAIWSCPPAKMRDYPLAAFARFFENHGLLKVKDRPQWRTIEGGSRDYVRRLVVDSSARLCTNAPVSAVRSCPGGVIVTTADGQSRSYAQAVMACHSDTALRLLGEPSALQRDILGGLTYQRNLAILHTDRALMPRRRRLWSSWNYSDRARSDEAPVAVTYWMNRLQGLACAEDIFVSLNPPHCPDEALIHGVFEYDHPVFDRKAIAAQKRIGEIQGRGGLWFAGAYLGHGFHEDAIQSGLAVAEAIGPARRPWGFDADQNRLAWDHRNWAARPATRVAA